jgi:hypothetical protein
VNENVGVLQALGALTVVGFGVGHAPVSGIDGSWRGSPMYRHGTAKLTERLKACLHGGPHTLDVAHRHGQCGVSNQPERLDRWYCMA